MKFFLFALMIVFSTTLYSQTTNENILFGQYNSTKIGIIWKNGGYTKNSASIMAVDFEAYARQGIGFFTGDFADRETAPLERMRITRDGKIGIGKTNPYAKLDVATGYVFFDIGNENRIVISDDGGDTNADSPKLCFFGRNYSGSHITGPSIQKINQTSYGRGRLAIFQHGGADYSSEEEVMSILPDGNVGIGTINANFLLTVNGTIGAKEIKVTNDITAYNVSVNSMFINSQPTSDFVFEEDYNLKPIEEVESFVNENKHLPEIASAQEMEENGINQAVMNQKLLQKVEELTLYIIEMNKEMKSLKGKVESLL